MARTSCMAAGRRRMQRRDWATPSLEAKSGVEPLKALQRREAAPDFRARRKRAAPPHPGDKLTSMTQRVGIDANVQRKMCHLWRERHLCGRAALQRDPQFAASLMRHIEPWRRTLS
jgi:hypothetical protein